MKCIAKTLLAALALTTLVFVGCKKRAESSGAPAASEKAGIGDVSLRDSDTSKADVIIRFCYYDTATWPNIARLPLPEHAYALTFKSMVESLSNNTIISGKYARRYESDDGNVYVGQYRNGNLYRNRFGFDAGTSSYFPAVRL